MAIIFIVTLQCSFAWADPADPNAPAPRPWVLLPFNVEDVPPEYLADGTEVLDKIIAAELEDRGIHFVQLSLVEGLRKWTNATEAVGGLIFRWNRFDSVSLDKARRQLIQDLLEEFSAAGVILPDIHERKAERERDSLSWDGVSRRISGPSEVRNVRVPGSCSSIRLRLFGVHGEELSDNYSGLEVIHRMKVFKREVSYSRTSFWYEFLVRTDLFEDRKLLSKVTADLLADGFP